MGVNEKRLMNVGKAFTKFTTYNVIATIIIVILHITPNSVLRDPPFLIVDIIRSTTSLTLVLFAYVYVVHGRDVIYDFYREMHGSVIPDALIIPWDALVHLLPVVLLGGPPRTIIGLAAGYLLLALYYSAIRNRVHDVYPVSISEREISTIMFTYLPACVIAYVIVFTFLAGHGTKKIRGSNNGGG